MRARPAALALALIASATALAGCGRGASAPAGRGAPRYFGSLHPPAGQVFRFNNGAEPEHLDPALASGQPDGRITRALFEGLVVSDPRTLEPAPGHAYRWEISADGRDYTFHLRPGLVWSDRAPLTARDFEWSWKRVLDPATGSRYAGLLFPVANAEAYNSGRLADADAVGIRASDDSTLVVRLADPTPHFLHLAALYTCLPVPRHAVERYGDRWTQPENIVGNGPFLLRRWEARARLVLERNPTYWDAAAVRLERVVAYSVDDAATSTNLYKAGMLDWSPSGYVPSQYLPYMRGYADFRSAPQQTVCFYSINVTRAPLDDVWVRRALTYALDRETLARRVLRGTRPAWGRFAPGGYPGYEPPPEIAYDPARARECLSRAGYPGGQGFPKIEILINTSDDRRRVAEAVQAMWKQTLGIPVGVTNLEWATYLDATAKLKYQVAVRNWIGDYPDPSTFLNCYRSGDGNNRTGWSSGPYDRLLAAAQGEGDPAARLRLLSRAEAILLDEAPVIPVYQFVTHELVKPYVRGLYATPLDYHPLKSVWIDHGGATGANAAARGAP